MSWPATYRDRMIDTIAGVLRTARLNRAGRTLLTDDLEALAARIAEAVNSTNATTEETGADLPASLGSTSRAYDEAELTAERQVRGVQGWMALDLHSALGRAFDPGADHQGHRSWADWWAELLAEVEQLSARLTEALRIVHHRLGHRGEPAACGLDVCETLRGEVAS